MIDLGISTAQRSDIHVNRELVVRTEDLHSDPPEQATCSNYLEFVQTSLY